MILGPVFPPVIVYVVMKSLIPGNLMREWKELLFRGLPLYEPTKSHQPELELSSSLDPAELKKQEILNNLEYDEYTVSLKHEYSDFKSSLYENIYIWSIKYACLTTHACSTSLSNN